MRPFVPACVPSPALAAFIRREGDDGAARVALNFETPVWFYIRADPPQTRKLDNFLKSLATEHRIRILNERRIILAPLSSTALDLATYRQLVKYGARPSLLDLQNNHEDRDPAVLALLLRCAPPAPALTALQVPAPLTPGRPPRRRLR